MSNTQIPQTKALHQLSQLYQFWKQLKRYQPTKNAPPQ